MLGNKPFKSREGLTPKNDKTLKGSLCGFQCKDKKGGISVTQSARKKQEGGGSRAGTD